MTATVPVDVTSVTLPKPNPWPYGLLGAATIIDHPDGHWVMGAEAESIGCTIPGGVPVPDFCAPWSKSVTYGPKWLEGAPLVVPLLGQCNAVGLDVPDLNDRMRAAYDLAESRELENRFIAWMVANPSEHIAFGSFGGPVQAVAQLEDQYARAGGVAQPLAHVSRGVATMLAAGGGVVRSGGRLETLTGTTIAAYTAKMPSRTGSTPPLPTTGAYMTGPVTFVRGDLHLYPPVLNKATNVVTVMMERAYLMFVDNCAMVTTTIDFCGCPAVAPG